MINDPQLRLNDIVVPLEGAGGKLTSTISSPIQVHGVAKAPAKRAPATRRAQRAGSRAARLQRGRDRRVARQRRRSERKGACGVSQTSRCRRELGMRSCTRDADSERAWCRTVGGGRLRRPTTKRREVSCRRSSFSITPPTAISKPWRMPWPKARAQAGAQVDVKRVPELVPEEIAAKAHYKLDQAAADREDRRSRRL